MDIHNVLPVGTQIGDFRVEMVLGAGASGIVYRAVDASAGQVVAIKEYFPADLAVRLGDGNVVARSKEEEEAFAGGRLEFLDEARVLAGFDHRSIVRVLRHLEGSGSAYTVMAYVEGERLRDLLARGERLSEEQAIKVLEPLLEGLALVHAAGVTHRDITPENIYIRSDGTPVLLDFGSARRAVRGRESRLTFTPPYAPLEQYGTRRVQGPWTDIYALGAVVYEALTRRRIPEAIDRIENDPLIPLEEFERFTSPLIRFVSAALAVKAELRPQSVTEWRTLLDPKSKWQPAFPMQPARDQIADVAPATLRNAAMQGLPVGARVGDLRIEELMGVSGFDIAYRAHDEVLGKTVVLREYFPRPMAVRMTNGSVNPLVEGGEKFIAGRQAFIEAFATRVLINHPNIARVYRLVPWNTTYYAVTEYVGGESLKKLLSGRRKFDEQEVAGPLLALMEGLEQIHQNTALHLHIEPNQILIQSNRRPVLRWDIGLEGSLGSTRILVPPYAAIEQYPSRGVAVLGPFTDIYTLGAIAYEALSGRSIPAAPDRIGDDPLVPLSNVTRVSAPMARAVMAALAVEGSRRPQSIAKWRAMMKIRVVS